MTDLDATFSPRLRPGERLVWTGRAGGGVRFRALDWFLVPFSLLWGGFAIFWELGALAAGVFGASASHGAGGVLLAFPLFGVPFVLVGLFMIFGRFLLDAWLREGTAYALTDQRILISRSRGGRSLQTAELTDDIRLSGVRPDGRGTVGFGPEPGLFGFGAGAGFSIWVPALSRSPEFAMIPDAERVFDMAQQQAASRPRR